MAGDSIDRGRHSYEMLKWIEHRPANVWLIRGNHEEEFASCIDLMLRLDEKEGLGTDYCSHKETAVLYSFVKYFLKNEGLAGSYFDLYGTINSLVNDSGIALEDLCRWVGIIREMPYYRELTVGDRTCIVVHAGYAEKMENIKSSFSSRKEFYLYAREDFLRLGGKQHGMVIAGEEDKKRLTAAAVLMLEIGETVRAEGMLAVYKYMEKKTVNESLKRILRQMSEGTDAALTFETAANEYWEKDPQGISAMVFYIYLLGADYIYSGYPSATVMESLRPLLPEGCHEKFDRKVDKINNKWKKRKQKQQKQMYLFKQKEALQRQEAEKLLHSPPVIINKELPETVHALGEDIGKLDEQDTPYMIHGSCTGVFSPSELPENKKQRLYMEKIIRLCKVMAQVVRSEIRDPIGWYRNNYPDFRISATAPYAAIWNAESAADEKTERCDCNMRV